MASCVRNIHTKNYYHFCLRWNRKCPGCFLRHSVYMYTDGQLSQSFNDRQTQWLVPNKSGHFILRKTDKTKLIN